MTNTAVVLIIFNRPQLTQAVFEHIRQVRPRRLYVIADGPRPGVFDDVAKCHAAREVVENVDWKCDVIKNYSNCNLGCGARIATGLDWVFQHEEQAIILEDDCLPHPNFFAFCSELLDRYNLNNQVMHISGNNCAIRTGIYSYYFSRIPHCWGWATWRRAWRFYDFHLKSFPHVRSTGGLHRTDVSTRTARFWIDIFERMYGMQSKHTWDYQWAFACFANDGLSVTPNATLVSNRGFSTEATHTRSLNHPLAALPLEDMQFPLCHPLEIHCDIDVDNRIMQEIFGVNRVNDLFRILKQVLRRK